MSATQKQYGTQIQRLKILCRIAKNLYNVGLYQVRQHYFQTKEYLRYESNYHVAKLNENYRLLNSNMAQQVLKEVEGVFRSFFGLLKAKSSGSYSEKVRLPRYLKKEGYYPLIIGQIRIKTAGEWDVPMSVSAKKRLQRITIQSPSNLQGKRIKEIRILPIGNARSFEVHYSYEYDVPQSELHSNHILAIDMGVNNLLTCVTNRGKSFIVDGRRLKSWNQWFNKENARLQSIRDKQGFSGITKRQAALYAKRNRCVRDVVNKAARYVINYCIQHKIGTMVFGYNLDIQQNVKLGKRNNQAFVQIPFGQLKFRIQQLCGAYGILFVEQEESYTSQADFLAGDRIPVYEAGQSNSYTFSGKRILRGLYRSTRNVIVNADCNGALNILKKSNLGGAELLHLQARGFLDDPCRIRVA